MKKPVVALTLLAAGIALTGCEEVAESNAQRQGQKLTEQAYEQQSAAVPYPADQLRDSLERRNLRERLLRQNDPDKIGYVYILSFGEFIGYYTIEGKVSSTQSQMTTDVLVERHGDAGGGNFTYTAPGDDGSYGENESGVFFFTTEGAMVQVSTDYIYADQPIAIANVPELNGGKR